MHHIKAATGEFSDESKTKPNTAHDLVEIKLLQLMKDCCHLLFLTSDQSRSADPALVPTVCGPAGDETQVHVEHFPVY